MEHPMFIGMNEQELLELRKATDSVRSTKLEMLANLAMTLVRHGIDRELARRRELADAAAKAKETKSGEQTQATQATQAGQARR